jgi:DNA adenine methylase
VITELNTRQASKKFRAGGETLQPFLKWAGGKRQLIPFITKYLPSKFSNYYEPFVGAGALLLHILPKSAIINDVNTELINCYKVIRDLHLDLIEDLRKHKNTKEYFYKIRELDRKREFKNLSYVQRASRIIYLNKTCYNGLFRVNKQGQFNAPYGRYRNPKIVNDEVICSINQYINTNDVNILNVDFAKAVETAKRGDFIYFDPPYDPLSDTSSFTGYSLYQFGKNEQERLKDVFDKVTVKGCLAMISNSSTEFIEKLYSDYNIIRLQANRNINSVGSGRKKIDEFLILNYIPDNEVQ